MKKSTIYASTGEKATNALVKDSYINPLKPNTTMDPHNGPNVVIL